MVLYHAKPLQACLTLDWLCDPLDCSPPGSSLHGILRARILQWVAMPFCCRSRLVGNNRKFRSTAKYTERRYLQADSGQTTYKYIPPDQQVADSLGINSKLWQPLFSSCGWSLFISTTSTVVGCSQVQVSGGRTEYSTIFDVVLKEMANGWGKRRLVQQTYIKINVRDFPSGPVVRTPPANAEVPSLVQEDSTCLGATSPRCNYWARMLWNLCSPTGEQPLLAAAGESLHAATILAQNKENNFLKCLNK